MVCRDVLTQQELTEEDLRAAMLVASVNRAMLCEDAIWGEFVTHDASVTEER